VHQSLLIQLVSVYLLFAVVVLLGGVGVDAVIEQQLRTDVQAANQALAQEIAVQTSLQFRDAENALAELGNLAAQAGTPEVTARIFQAWKAARSDVDHVYWLDPVGDVVVFWPSSGQIGVVGLGGRWMILRK
jgi:hypothetical protein